MPLFFSFIYFFSFCFQFLFSFIIVFFMSFPFIIFSLHCLYLFSITSFYFPSVGLTGFLHSQPDPLLYLNLFVWLLISYADTWVTRRRRHHVALCPGYLRIPECCLRMLWRNLGHGWNMSAWRHHTLCSKYSAPPTYQGTHPGHFRDLCEFSVSVTGKPRNPWTAVAAYLYFEGHEYPSIYSMEWTVDTVESVGSQP